MALLSNGILGKVTGKVANVITSTWRGKNVVKSYNPSPRNPQTPAQTTQRNLFAYVVAFVKSFLQFVREVNLYTKINLPPYNIAVSKTIENLKTLGLSGDQLNLSSFVPIASNDFNITANVTTLNTSEIIVSNITGIDLSENVEINFVIQNVTQNKNIVVSKDRIHQFDQSTIEIDVDGYGFVNNDLIACATVLLDKLNKQTSNYLFLGSRKII